MKTRIMKILGLFGAFLIILGIAVLVFWQWNIQTSSKKTVYYTDTLRTLMPEIQSAAPEKRLNNSMSALSLDGVDFAGIIEIPRFRSSLPVGASFGKIHKYPCIFSGSVYDGTIKIGATSQDGQYDFYREISVGDTVLFTDMEGNRFTYSVTDLRYEKHADTTTLSKKESSLVLFIKNVYSFDYLIVYCNVK